MICSLFIFVNERFRVVDGLVWVMGIFGLYVGIYSLAYEIRDLETSVSSSKENRRSSDVEFVVLAVKILLTLLVLALRDCWLAFVCFFLSLFLFLSWLGRL